MPIKRNQAWGQRIVLKSSTGAAVNLTGVPLRMQFRKKPEDAVSLVDMTTANGKIVISGAVSGQIDLALNSADTEKLPVGQVFWDLIRTDTNQPFCGGYAIIEQGVTR